MIEKKIRFPEDEWAAIELMAKRLGLPSAQVVRTGTLSYVAYSLARAGDETTLAFDDLWAAALRVVLAWPL